jgi:hypothetical protein
MFNECLKHNLQHPCQYVTKVSYLIFYVTKHCKKSKVGRLRRSGESEIDETQSFNALILCAKNGSRAHFWCGCR